MCFGHYFALLRLYWARDNLGTEQLMHKLRMPPSYHLNDEILMCVLYYVQGGISKRVWKFLFYSKTTAIYTNPQMNQNTILHFSVLLLLVQNIFIMYTTVIYSMQVNHFCWSSYFLGTNTQAAKVYHTLKILLCC